METNSNDPQKAKYVLLGVILILTSGAFITVMMYLATGDLVKAFTITAIAIPIFWGLTMAAINPADNWLRELPHRLGQLLSDLWSWVRQILARPRVP